MKRDGNGWVAVELNDFQFL